MRAHRAYRRCVSVLTEYQLVVAELARRRRDIDEPPESDEYASLSDAELRERLSIPRAPEIIYKPDDRRDLYEPDVPATAVTAAAAVALVCNSGELTFTNQMYVAQTTPLATAVERMFPTPRPICDGQVFMDQPTFGYGTAFFVAPNCVVTAGHVVAEAKMQVTEMRFVLGFQMTNATTAVTQFSPSQVFSGVRIIRGQFKTAMSDPDFAVIEVVNAAGGTGAALPVSQASTIATQTPVWALGHPNGLPIKYASNAQVRRWSGSSYMIANLDMFSGNSGSPVFDVEANATGGTVIGILVAGGADYEKDRRNTCIRARSIPKTGAQGEWVQWIGQAVGKLYNLSVTMTFGAAAITPARSVYLLLSSTVGIPVLIPTAGAQPSSSITAPVPFGDAGVTSIDDIDAVTLFSPTSLRPSTANNWTLARVTISVNGLDNYWDSGPQDVVFKDDPAATQVMSVPFPRCKGFVSP